MKSNYYSYDFEKSRARIDDILRTSDNSYEELNSIPSRDKLTFNNGFYVNCTALFVDIRKSSELPDKYKRPKLSRIYRSFISEVVAIINGNFNCSEINIQGDSVWAIFDTPYQHQINGVINTSAEISSIIDTLNCKLKKKSIDPLSIGIGIDYGRALMIKAGYNGSGINDVVWMGDVVNYSSKLCSYANQTWLDSETFISQIIYNNLYEEIKKYFSYTQNRNCYQGNIINISLNEWNEENCNK